ncbi:MAG: hypothetical protein KH431_09870 [Erysipelotrichaceae bacterium]|nr:hypothetical protein [Erysipelotrichaceae bacterium]
MNKKLRRIGILLFVCAMCFGMIHSVQASNDNMDDISVAFHHEISEDKRTVNIKVETASTEEFIIDAVAFEGNSRINADKAEFIVSENGDYDITVYYHSLTDKDASDLSKTVVDHVSELPENVSQNNGDNKEIHRNAMKSDTLPSNRSTSLQPTTFDELNAAITNASDNDIIDLSSLTSDGKNHTLNITKNLVLAGSGNTIEGIYIEIDPNQTCTLRNIVIKGSYIASDSKKMTVAGQDANLIVERDATLIGSSEDRPMNYMSGRAVVGLKNVTIYGTVQSGNGSNKLERGAIGDCYKVVVDGGKIIGSTVVANKDSHGSANSPLLNAINYLVLNNASIIGCKDSYENSSGGNLINYAYHVSITNSYLQPAEVNASYTLVSISNSTAGHTYARDSALLLDIKGTNLIQADSKRSTGYTSSTDYSNGSSDTTASAIKFDMAQNQIDAYDKVSPAINIGADVTIQGGNTTVGNASSAIICWSNTVPVIVNMQKGSKVIGGSTTDTSADTYGGNGTTGAQVNTDGALVQGGKGTYGGYAISRCWSDSTFAGDSQIIGGEGYKVGGHAVYNASKITVDNAVITGGKAPAFADETQHAGSAVNRVNTLVLNDGILSPGEGGYATCYITNLYMRGGAIYNSGGHIEPHTDDPNKPAVHLYNSPTVQISGGQIGYMNYGTTKYLAIWGSGTTHWSYRKEDRKVQWQDSIYSGSGYTLYADEVISDGVNITDTTDIKKANNIYSQFSMENKTESGNVLIYGTDTVTVTFPRAITEDDLVIISARNWDKRDAPYEALEIPVTLVNGGSDGKIEFKQPARSIRVELRKKSAVADDKDNKIVDLDIKKQYIVNEMITFKAVGVNMDEANPGLNDIRYKPVAWSVNPNGTWENAPYTASFQLTKPGIYTLKVTFAKEQYLSQDKWIKTDETVQKEVKIEVKEADSEKEDDKDTPKEDEDTPKKDTDNSDKESNASAETSDSTNKNLWLLFLLTSFGTIILLILKKCKSYSKNMLG